MDNKRPVIWMIDGLGPGGAEQLMPTILKHLMQTGLNLRVCALQVKHGNPIGSELERLGLPIDLILIPNLRHPLNLFRILRYLKLHNPELLHTQLEFSDILGTIAAKILRIPTVSTLHTLDVSEETGTATWRLKLRWLILRFSRCSSRAMLTWHANAWRTSLLRSYLKNPYTNRPSHGWIIRTNASKRFESAFFCRKLF